MSNSLDATANIAKQNPHSHFPLSTMVLWSFIDFFFAECLINPTPGICLENQRKTFWTFSTKTNSCTRITGCFDIHDRNTWLTLNGCRNNCFKNESQEEPLGVLPLGKSEISYWYEAVRFVYWFVH